MCKQKQYAKQLQNNNLIQNACSGYQNLSPEQIKNHNMFKLQEANLPFCSIDFKSMYTDDVKAARQKLFNSK